MGGGQSTETNGRGGDERSTTIPSLKASHKARQIDCAKALAERAARSFVEPIDLNDPAAQAEGW